MPVKRRLAPIELRIFRGADGKFSVYEDEGDTYHREEGAHALIPLPWSKSEKTLTIGDCERRLPRNAQRVSIEHCLGISGPRCRRNGRGQT